MIAAGSLFTSCVENTEPQGIKDIREAKANYLDALANLRAADAELVKAQAAYKQAEIALVEANAALQQAYVEEQKLKNEAREKLNEYASADLDAKIAGIKAAAEKAAVEAQEALAKAQQSLDQTLKRIAAQSIGLTVDEKLAIKRKTDALKKAQDKYHDAFVDVENAKKAIWEKEYDLAAGYENIDIKNEQAEAIHDYESDIAEQAAIIVENIIEIASAEAMKEDPEKIKDELEAFADSIKLLRQDSVLAEKELVIYEASVLKEANEKYTKAREAFIKDSIPAGKSFDFKGTYDLTNGKSLDAQFKVFVDTYAKNVTFASDVKKFTVASKSEGSLDSTVSALKSIVAALNRDQVVLDNIADSTSIEDAKKAYEIADSTYKADYAILKAGLKEYKEYKLANDTLKMYKDTLKAARTDSTNAAKKLAGDTATVLKNVTENLAPAYKKAVKDFVNAAVLFNVRQDTVNLINTVNALGNAQNAYIGRQDTVRIDREFTVGGEKHTLKTTVKFNEIVVKDFKLNDSPAGAFFDAILSAANCNQSGITDAKVAETVKAEKVGTYQETSKFAFDLSGVTSKKDTIDWFKNHAKGAYTDFTEDEAALNLAKAAVVKAIDQVAEKEAKVNDAKTAFTNIGKKFWNVETFDADAYKIVWSDKTFAEPENCVIFKAEGDSILPSKTLNVVLDGIYKDTLFVTGAKNVNKHDDCAIFFGTGNTNNNRTEFANALYKYQVYEALGSYESRKAQLEQINKQVAALESAVKTYKEDYKKANEAHNAGVKRLTGGKGDVVTLSRSNVSKGAWNLAGKQKELAEQFAPEFPAVVAAAEERTKVVGAKIKEAEKYVEVLTNCYVEYTSYVNWGDEKKAASVQGIIDILNNHIEDAELAISSATEKIAVYEKAIAEIEAGYDVTSIELKVLYDELAKCENALAVAEEALARAQKEYDEVIAKYGVKE